MTQGRITFAICTYCRPDLLRRAVASAIDQSLGPDEFEILIVDNSPEQLSSPTTREEFAAIPNLRWLQAPARGLSSARNVAITACATPLLAFLDDDAVATPRWLWELEGAFQAYGNEVCVAGGRVDPQWQAPRPVWLPDELLGHLSIVDWGDRMRFLGPREWLAGTNMAFRVADLRRIGGFSSKFGRFGGEEVLLSNDENDVISRLEGEGGRALYVPDAVVQHLVPATRLTQSWIRRRVVWQAVSDYMQRPGEMYSRVGGFWRRVERFNESLAIEFEAPNCFYVEQSDPEVFSRQMSALYSYTIVMLTGFRDVRR